MMTIRAAAERGHVEFGWLDTRHSFSFGNYYDPAQMGFRALRVINEDRVEPGAGFDAHPHRDMEILTVVLAGALEHRDSMGNGSVIRPGEVQRMTAGTGVVHSEHNVSATEPLHLLQIWIQPAQAGLPPGYEQRDFPVAERGGRLRLLASADGRDGSLTLHQDAALYATALAPGERVEHLLAAGRHAWVQVTRGSLHVNGLTVQAGDGMAFSAEREVVLEAEPEAGTANGTATGLHAGAVASAGAEALLFDLA